MTNWARVARLELEKQNRNQIRAFEIPNSMLAPRVGTASVRTDPSRAPICTAVVHLDPPQKVIYLPLPLLMDEIKQG